MSLFRSFVALLVMACTPSAFAQWTPMGADLAGQFGKWKENAQDPYSPELAIGASSLAFDADGTLYLACEKHADVLVFPKDGSAPGRIRLTGVPLDKGFPDVDLEGMSIHDGTLYIVDEDKLCVYSTPLRQPGAVSTLAIEYDGVTAIDGSPTDGSDRKEGNLSSVEGIVVSSTYHGPKSQRGAIGEGPYVYLLDELDITDRTGDAKLYVGVLKDGRIRISIPPVSFALTKGYRLPELFEAKGKLYAIKSDYAAFNRYEVVQLDIETKSLNDPCDFTTFAKGRKMSGYDTNYEGAAVNPADGRLFLTADNENYSDASGSDTPPMRPMRPRLRGCTPIICLKGQP